jgi:hypothetical protein
MSEPLQLAKKRGRFRGEGCEWHVDNQFNFRLATFRSEEHADLFMATLLNDCTGTPYADNVYYPETNKGEARQLFRTLSRLFDAMSSPNVPQTPYLSIVYLRNELMTMLELAERQDVDTGFVGIYSDIRELVSAADAYFLQQDRQAAGA